ncbi:hypothetical protein AAHA92_13651 [Salvia divinorum]|uniref:Uncharacterized protein n=1 Tax=Salvia divinorum TaxID=28513 RepID=A0ABD1HCS8_SALDI
MPKAAMAFTIAASILGQVIGSRAERYRLKTATDARKSKLAETSIIEPNQATVTGIKYRENAYWSLNSLQVPGASSSPEVFC